MSKILVIDDEPLMREMVRVGLESMGFDVVEAADDARGGDMARQHLPDLILCDIKMAGRPDAGYKLLAQLRENTATAAIPFILMTGQADDLGMRHGMGLGADDYLLKPILMEEIYRTVNARLQKVKTVRAEAEKKLSLLRSQISRMMPHEMNTPLNGIMAYGELLRTDAAAFKPGEIAEMGQVIAESGRRLHRLIGNFLIYAQLESTASDPEKIALLRAAKTGNVAETARAEAVSQADSVHRPRDLVLQLADLPDAVAMSEIYFRNIVAELVQNAFKFSKPGQSVQVGLAQAGNLIELTVRDSGCGFTSDQISRIGAYLQFDRKSEDRQGLGLGLAIVKILAELHNGSFAIVSTPGEGSTVTVKIPKSA